MCWAGFVFVLKFMVKIIKQGCTERRKKNTSSYGNVGVVLQREVVKRSLRKKWRLEQFGELITLSRSPEERGDEDLWYFIELPVKFHHILFKKHRKPCLEVHSATSSNTTGGPQKHSISLFL